MKFRFSGRILAISAMSDALWHPVVTNGKRLEMAVPGWGGAVKVLHHRGVLFHARFSIHLGV